MPQEKYYLTKGKLKELKKEYEDLIALERAKSRNEAPRVLESEDINSEYFIFQEDLNFLRTRINDLENIIKNYELIKTPSKEKQKIIGLGAKILVEVGKERDEFTIVGTLEANPSVGKISSNSPVGQALVGHKIGDEITVSSPIKAVYKILKISYPSL